MTAKPLTPMQSRVLEIIAGHIATAGLSPTYRQVAKAIGATLTTASEHIHALRDKGWITLEKHRANSIRVVGCCPVCGRGN